MTRERVLQIGMDPEVIDFSAWPGQDAATLRRRIGEAEAALRKAGFEVTVCLLRDDPDTADAAVAASFAHGAFDVVEIGPGCARPLSTPSSSSASSIWCPGSSRVSASASTIHPRRPWKRSCAASPVSSRSTAPPP